MSTHSYRRLALKFHPLKNNNDHNVLDRFNNLAEAYDILVDRMFLFSFSIHFFALFKLKNELFMINMVMKV